MPDTTTTSPTSGGRLALMENLLGLLRIRIIRGVNLAVRDVRSSDPYVVVKMGKQSLKHARRGEAAVMAHSRRKDGSVMAQEVSSTRLQVLQLLGRPLYMEIWERLKTRVIKKDVNPVWNEDLTLSVSDPNTPIKLTVYDHDTFSKDDKMGYAEFDIKSFMEALKMNLDNLPSGTTITRMLPSRSNCYAEETCVVWKDGKVIQDIYLRLKDVECGEVEIQLQWIELPHPKG